MPSLDNSHSRKGWIELRVAVNPRSGAIDDMLELKQALVLLVESVACSTEPEQIRATVALALKRAGIE